MSGGDPHDLRGCSGGWCFASACARSLSSRVMFVDPNGGLSYPTASQSAPGAVGGDQFIEIDKNSGTTLKAVQSC